MPDDKLNLDEKETSPPVNRFTRQSLIRPVQSEESDIPIPLIPPDKNRLTSFISGTIRRRIRDVMGPEPFDSPLIYDQLKQTIQDTLTEMEEAVDWYRTELSDYIYDLGTDFTKRKWIVNDPITMANLNKKRNRHLLRIMTRIAKAQLPFPNTYRYGMMEIEGEKQWPGLSKSDIASIAKIAKEEGISKSLVHLYILGAIESGFLKRFGTKYRGSFLVVSVHAWYKNKKGEEKHRPIYLLKETPAMRKALRTFRRPDKNEDKKR